MADLYLPSQIKQGDVIVTVPKWFGLDTWIEEGDPAGMPWSGQDWHFFLGGQPPRIAPGDRVYIVFNGKLRGYAPLVHVEIYDQNRYALVRRGDAVAVTIDEYIRGFRGFQYRWWPYEAEKPFPDWMKP